MKTFPRKEMPEKLATYPYEWSAPYPHLPARRPTRSSAFRGGLRGPPRRHSGEPRSTPPGWGPGRPPRLSRESCSDIASTGEAARREAGTQARDAGKRAKVRQRGVTASWPG